MWSKHLNTLTCSIKFFSNQPLPSAAVHNDNNVTQIRHWWPETGARRSTFSRVIPLPSLFSSGRIVTLIPLGTDKWLLGSTSFCWVSFWGKPPQNTRKVPFPATRWAAAPACGSWAPAEGWTVVLATSGCELWRETIIGTFKKHSLRGGIWIYSPRQVKKCFVTTPGSVFRTDSEEKQLRRNSHPWPLAMNAVVTHLWTCRQSHSRSRCCRLEADMRWARGFLKGQRSISQTCAVRYHVRSTVGTSWGWLEDKYLLTRLSSVSGETPYLSEMWSQQWTSTASSAFFSHVSCSKWSWSSGPAVNKINVNREIYH